MAKKKEKHLLSHRWHKWDKVWVYEGKYGVAVGNKPTGYSVFGDKKKVDIHKDGKITYRDDSGFMGSYATRKEVVDLIKEIDQGMSNGGEVTTITMTSVKDHPVEAFSHSDAGTGGTLLVFEKDDTVGRIHEGCHYLLGHHKKGSHKGSKTSFKEEKEAVETAIRWHKLRDEYTPEVRQKIIERFATYFKDKSEKTKLRKAEKFVKGVEN